MNIEKGIPVPKRRGNKVYPFGEMEVGDSFFVETDRPEKIRSSASVFCIRNGGKFTIRKDGDGYRCWKVR